MLVKTYSRSRSPIVIGWSKVSHLNKCWSNPSRPTFDQLGNARLTSMLVTHCECSILLEAKIMVIGDDFLK